MYRYSHILNSGGFLDDPPPRSWKELSDPKEPKTISTVTNTSVFKDFLHNLSEQYL